MHPDITSGKHKGNPASNSAWENNHGRHANARERILQLIADAADGLTSKEIAAQLGWPIHCLSGRLSELKRDAKIRGTGVRRMGAEVMVVVRMAEQMSLLGDVA